MTSKSDDLVEELRQNLELRRGLAAEVAKATDSNAKRSGKMAGKPRPPKLTTTEARQATGPRAMIGVLIGSLALAVIAGLVLGLAFGWIPLPWSVTP